MNVNDRLPRVRGSPAGSPRLSRLLRMPEDEYAELLRQHGYGERYIGKELAQLREARERHTLPGPPEAPPGPKDEGTVDRLVRRRKGKNPQE